MVLSSTLDILLVYALDGLPEVGSSFKEIFHVAPFEKNPKLNVFSRVLRDSTPRFVGPSVGWSVGRSPFYFFSVFELFEPTAPAQMLS